MTVRVFEKPKIWVGSYDFSANMSSVAVDAGAEMLDASAFGDDTRKRVAGMKTVAIQHEGFWDSTPDKQFFDNIALADVPISIGPETGADGELAYAMKALLAEYTPGAEIGALLGFSVSGEADKIVRGTIMHNAAEVASGNGVARQLGSVSASQKLYASMHVIAASASDTLDVVVESDAASGFASPITRITFAQFTAIGSKWATPIAGAITDDWWRVTWTIGGTSPSFTFIVVISIK